MVTCYFKEKPNWTFERLNKRIKESNYNNDDNKNNEEISLFNPVSGLNPINGFSPISNNLSRMKNNNSPTMDRHIKAFKLPPGTVTSIDCEC